MQLTTSQKQHLRGLAHHLKPVVWIGQQGLRESVLAELDLALDTHELIKVKIAAERDERKSIIQALCDHSGATLVQGIGQMAVLFKRNTKKPKVALPSN